MAEIRIDALGAVRGIKKTPQGFLVAPANLTRVGVLTYTRPDGTQVRELRPPEEVGRADSLESLVSAPLTVDHPLEVNPGNWRQLSVGHVKGTPRMDGPYVASSVQVEDASAISRVESKELTELSCGYRCDVDPTPGVWEGERYDQIQRNIVYNHVALGPKDWGRAGNEVRIRLDAASNQGVLVAYSDTEMADPNTPALVTHADAEALRGQVAALTSENSKLKADLALANDPKRLDSLVAARVTLVGHARSHLGPEYKADGKSDVEVQREVLARLNPDLRLDGMSSDFIGGAFNAAITSATKATAATVAIQTATPTPETVRADASGDTILSAYERNAERSRNAWKTAAK